MVFISKVLGVYLGLSSTFALSSVPERQPCTPKFPYAEGWIGGDAVFSVRLDEASSRTLWLFGDTFVNPRSPLDRATSSLVDNSIGLSNCVDGKFSIQYFWGPQLSSDDKPSTYFSGLEDSTWPGGSIRIGDKVYIFGIRVRKAVTGFELLGTRLITIEHIGEEPRLWRYHMVDFLMDSELLIGVSVVREGDHLLLFSSLHRRRGQPMVLLRCPVLAIEQCHPELWTEKGWQSYNGDLSQVKILLEGASTEFSVSRRGDQWMAIYNSVAHFPFASTIDLARTENIYEGFRSQKVLSRLPSPEELHAPGAFCYASKEHPHFRSQDQVVTTYVCNSWNFFGETIPFLHLYQVQVKSFDLD